MLRLAAVLLLFAGPALAACDSGQAGAEAAAPSQETRDTASRTEAPAVPAAAEAPELPAEEATDDGLPAEQGTWREVGRWRGDGSKNTQSFAIRSREWRIAYSATQTEGSRVVFLSVSVSKAGDRSRVTRASTRRAGADTTYVHEGPGRYYLEIASGGAEWEVSVHDLQLPAERVEP